jgi:hypothetical protein
MEHESAAAGSASRLREPALLDFEEWAFTLADIPFQKAPVNILSISHLKR